MCPRGVTCWQMLSSSKIEQARASGTGVQGFWNSWSRCRQGSWVAGWTSGLAGGILEVGQHFGEEGFGVKFRMAGGVRGWSRDRLVKSRSCNRLGDGCRNM